MPPQTPRADDVGQIRQIPHTPQSSPIPESGRATNWPNSHFFFGPRSGVNGREVGCKGGYKVQTEKTPSYIFKTNLGRGMYL